MSPLNTKFEKRLIWNFADAAPGRDENIWRLDYFDSLMCWTEYGLKTEFGWIIAVLRRRAGVSLSNKLPLHWQNVGKLMEVEGHLGKG